MYQAARLVEIDEITRQAKQVAEEIIARGKVLLWRFMRVPTNMLSDPGISGTGPERESDISSKRPVRDQRELQKILLDLPADNQPIRPIIIRSVNDTARPTSPDVRNSVPWRSGSADQKELKTGDIRLRLSII
jgi:hypothetical protein